MQCPHCGASVDSRSTYCPYDGTPLAHIEGGLAGYEVQPGTTLDGRYQILEELGRGGTGIVLRARNLALDREVALKVLRHDIGDADRTIARFAREARATSRVDSPHVARVFDFGFAAEGVYFLAMELLRGRPLSDWLSEIGYLPPARAVHLLRQIASGTARAHELGVIHRDLKPSNVIVDVNDHCTIIDFGLSRASDRRSGKLESSSGMIIGTPEYMSPEQWRGPAVDHRSDIYSFGVLAYELLSGRLPLWRETQVQMLFAVLQQTPEPVADMVPSPIAEELSQLVGQCLEKDPERRPQSMRAIAEGLMEIAARPVTLRPPAPGQADGTPPLEDDGLVREMTRLRRSRSGELAELLSVALPSRPELQAELLASVAIDEAEVARAEAAWEDVFQRSRTEAARDRRREADLRARVVDASLRVASERGGFERAELDEWSDTIPPPGDAFEALQRAESELGRYLSAGWPAAQERGQRNGEDAKADLGAAHDRLAKSYAQLVARLSGGTSHHAWVIDRLERFAEALALYRENLRSE